MVKPSLLNPVFQYVRVIHVSIVNVNVYSNVTIVNMRECNTAKNGVAKFLLPATAAQHYKPY